MIPKERVKLAFFVRKRAQNSEKTKKYLYNPNICRTFAG
jgi:hypothetical protein